MFANGQMGAGALSSSGSLLVALVAFAILFGAKEVWAQSSTLVLPANVEWLDTGIDVQSGVVFVLTISATGSWSNVAAGQAVGAVGYGSLRLPNAIAPDEPFASLIGRVNGTVFGIGERFGGSSPATGRLFLAMNDVPGTFGDNSGALTVVVGRGVNHAVTTWEDPVLFVELLSSDPLPFFERPIFRWTLKNRLLAPFSAELHVLLDSARTSVEPPSPVILDFKPGSERTGTFALFTGVNPTLVVGEHTVTVEVRALTANHERLASRDVQVTSFAPSAPPSVTITDFKADPDYQDLGKEISLTWAFQPSNFCIPADLVLTKKDYGEPDLQLLQTANPVSPGEKKDIVSGTSSPLTYVLSVACRYTVGGQTQPGTAKSKELKFTFGQGPPTATSNVISDGPWKEPSQPKAMLPLSISWRFRNVGGAKSVEVEVDIYLDGVKQDDEQTIPELDAGKSSKLTWDIKKLVEGPHTIELRRVSDGGSLGYHPFNVLP